MKSKKYDFILKLFSTVNKLLSKSYTTRTYFILISKNKVERENFNNDNDFNCSIHIKKISYEELKLVKPYYYNDVLFFV